MKYSLGTIYKDSVRIELVHWGSYHQDQLVMKYTFGAVYRDSA